MVKETPLPVKRETEPIKMMRRGTELRRMTGEDDSLVGAAIPVPGLVRGLAAAVAHANRVIRVTWRGLTG